LWTSIAGSFILFSLSYSAMSGDFCWEFLSKHQGSLPIRFDLLLALPNLGVDFQTLLFPLFI
jgi:hypothetical protein